MIIQPWSPDPDKYVFDCERCNESGVVFAETGTATAVDPKRPDDVATCPDCEGTGITVDWAVVEPALLDEGPKGGSE